MEPVRLCEAEVLGVANVKAVLSVQSEDRRVQQIFRGHAWFSAVVLKRGRIVEPLTCGGHARFLDDPDELLTAVIIVQRHGDLADSRRDGLRWANLELIDQILVIGGGEALALLLVQIDVVAEHLEPGDTDGGNGGTGLTRRRGHVR